MNDSKPGATAVLLLAHGSPDSPEQVPEFLLKVTGGRPLPPDVITEVKHRYAAIGSSPLTKITLQQAELLAAGLHLPVYVGMRNWHPFVADTINNMAANGVQRAVVICMAPQNSRTSVGLYRASLRASEDTRLCFDFVDAWHAQPHLTQAFAEKLNSGLIAAREAAAGIDPPVIFTAHSVPQRTIAEGDPYEAQARETASLVAKAAGLKEGSWRFAFQSQGMSGGAWLGPTVEATIAELKDEGHSGVFIQPIGFVCDHVEILYDIDVAFRQFAEGLGVRQWRAESLNASPLLTSALAEIVESRLSASKSS